MKTKTHTIYYATFPYNSIKTGENKKGAQGTLNVVTKSGYAINVTLFDRPGTEHHVQLAMLAVAAAVGPAVKW